MRSEHRIGVADVTGACLRPLSADFSHLSPSGSLFAPNTGAMRFAVFGLLAVVSIAATCVFFGWLESTANMTQGLAQLFAPGATTVIFSPLLLLFILLCLVVFVVVTLLSVTMTAVLGGLSLRPRPITLSQPFTRRFVIIAVILHFIFILVAIEQNAPFLLGRPQIHSIAPWALAALAAANSALNLFVAALIIRRLTPAATESREGCDC